MVREIELTQGRVALVDSIDYDWLSQYHWHVAVCGGTPPLEYARSGQFFMHRLILQVPAGVVVDHINHDGLDNRRANLRRLSHALNVRHARAVLSPRNRTGYAGVTRAYTKAERWRAYISVDGAMIHVGQFPTKEAAARAHDEAAVARFSAFARLNFPDEYAFNQGAA